MRRRTRIGKNMIRWRKVGGGSHKMRDGTVLEKGQVFLAPKEDVELELKLGVIEPLDDLTLDDLPEPSVVSLKVQHKGFGKFDVINTVTGKPINDRLLTRDEAEALVTEAEAKEARKEDADLDSTEDME